jgi:hypothetical protein
MDFAAKFNSSENASSLIINRDSKTEFIRVGASVSCLERKYLEVF